MVYTEKDKIRVVVATPAYRIEGDIHVLKGSRLTDTLNSKARDFFALTDVQVFDISSGEPLYRVEYIALNRAAASVVIPV